MRPWRRVLGLFAIVLVCAALFDALFLPVQPATTAIAFALGLALPFVVDLPRGVPIREPSGGQRFVFAPSRLVVVDSWIRLITIALFALATDDVMNPSRGISASGFLLAPFMLLALAGAIARTMQRLDGARSVLIEEESITFVDVGAKVVRFDDIAELSVIGSVLTLVTRAGERSVLTFQGLFAKRAAERTADAIGAAKENWERARGGRTATEQRLARASGQAPLAWLRHVDTLRVAEGARAGYREAGIDEEALWETLKRADALTHARAAAARILSRDEQTRVRVAELVRDIDEPRVRVTLEAALKPAEQAAAELEALEHESLERDVGRR